MGNYLRDRKTTQGELIGSKTHRLHVDSIAARTHPCIERAWRGCISIKLIEVDFLHEASYLVVKNFESGLEFATDKWKLVPGLELCSQSRVGLLSMITEFCSLCYIMKYLCACIWSDLSFNSCTALTILVHNASLWSLSQSLLSSIIIFLQEESSQSSKDNHASPHKRAESLE